MKFNLHKTRHPPMLQLRLKSHRFSTVRTSPCCELRNLYSSAVFSSSCVWISVSGSIMRQNKNSHHQQPENSWRRVLMRKWLKTAVDGSDYSADSDSSSDSDTDKGYCDWPRKSRFQKDERDQLQADANEPLPGLPRRNSETFRAQYINTKEIRVCAATWNVGGRTPPDDLDLEDWLDIDDPADIYVIGFQEIIPLNAGSIFGSEDSWPALKWEYLIRETLNRVPPITKFQSFSNPPSPSRFKLSEDAPDVADEVVLESDSDVEEEIHPVNDESNEFHVTQDGIFEGRNSTGAEPCASNNGDNFVKPMEHELDSQFSSPKKLNRMNCLRMVDSTEYIEASNAQCMHMNKLTKTLSGTERMGLSWPEPPLHLLPQPVFEKHSSSSKSFRTYSSFKSNTTENRLKFDLAVLSELDLESVINRRRRPPYVKLVSKQMVGMLITMWGRRSLRKHIQNLNVSTVGVGIMGYIGNKGSVSVSMSIHQTLFCFICTHLTAGEKEGDAIKRNSDVYGIHKRTHFNHLSPIGLPRRIYDHERIIWLGDLNYRINLSYEQTRELIFKKEWSKLLEQDQLVKEFRKGRAFDGWSEGTLNFTPTYKYELNSESYVGDDPKSGRRTPACYVFSPVLNCSFFTCRHATIFDFNIAVTKQHFMCRCDRILSFGPGMRLLSYKRSEFMLSDHRPVSASYMVEVEVFSPKKLQRALIFTDAEVEGQDIGADVGHSGRTG